MASMPQDVTVLLAQLTQGRREALSSPIPSVYEELRRLAAGYMRHERVDHTLQATALVNEAYLRLVQQASPNWRNRAHFFGVGAQEMRHILVDHARSHASQKRAEESTLLW